MHNAIKNSIIEYLINQEKINWDGKGLIKLDENEFCHAYTYNSLAYILSDDISDMLIGQGPIIYEKSDGRITVFESGISSEIAQRICIGNRLPFDKVWILKIPISKDVELISKINKIFSKTTPEVFKFVKMGGLNIKSEWVVLDDLREYLGNINISSLIECENSRFIADLEIQLYNGLSFSNIDDFSECLVRDKLKKQNQFGRVVFIWN